MRDYRLYLKDIIEAMESIEEFVAGMRDRLIHSYFGVDYALVWRAIKERIPRLKPQLQKTLQELG